MNTTGEERNGCAASKKKKKNPKDQNKSTETPSGFVVVVLGHSPIGRSSLLQGWKSRKERPPQQLRVCFHIYSPDVVIFSQKIDKDSL